MSKYVKLEDAKAILWGLSMPLCDYESAMKDIESLPATEIVRCKDCMHNNHETIDEIEENWCEIFRCEIDDDDFCSYGEKQVTGKLNNADDSLLTEELEACKEQKSKLDLQPTCNQLATDLISRQAAIEAIEKAYCNPCKERGDDYNGVRCRACNFDDAINQIDALPPVEPELVSGDTISKEALIQSFLADCECKDRSEAKAVTCSLDTMLELIDDAPPVEPKRPKGEWIEVEVFPEAYDIEGVKSWGSEMQCDQCGFRFTAIEGHIAQYNYCPNCGSRMVGNNDEKHKRHD